MAASLSTKQTAYTPAWQTKNYIMAKTLLKLNPKSSSVNRIKPQRPASSQGLQSNSKTAS